MNRILTMRSLNNTFMRTICFSHNKQILQTTVQSLGKTLAFRGYLWSTPRMISNYSNKCSESCSESCSDSCPNHRPVSSNRSSINESNKLSKENYVIPVGAAFFASSIPRIKIEKENLPFQTTRDETRLNENDMAFIETDLESITTDELENLKIMCKDYMDPAYVFKQCSINFNRDHFLIIMQKLDSTDTNESRRGVINPKYAKFRANELLVKRIIHLPTLTDRDNILHRFPSGCSAEYTVDDIIIDDMCGNKKAVHYYKTLHGAYFGFDFPQGYHGTREGYTGLWFECDDNGEISWIIEFKQGIEVRSVLWIRYNYYIYKSFYKQFHKRYMKELTDDNGKVTEEAVAGTFFNLSRDDKITHVDQYYN